MRGPFILFLIGITHLQFGRALILDLNSPPKFYDLTYSLSTSTIFYPGAKPYTLNRDHEEWKNNGSFWYSSFSFCMGEHGGTHLDAPYHFHPTGWTVDQIPSDHLINVPTTLVNVQPALDKLETVGPSGNFKIGVQDFMEHEQKFGRIESKSLILIYTGWSKFWPDRTKYLGLEENDLVKNSNSSANFVLRFPGLSLAAIQWLVDERQIVGIGLDTPSVDQGLDDTYPVHVFGASRQIYNLENVANLHLVAGADQQENKMKGFVLPLKIVGGTGAPVRILLQI